MDLSLVCSYSSTIVLYFYFLATKLVRVRNSCFQLKYYNYYFLLDGWSMVYLLHLKINFALSYMSFLPVLIISLSSSSDVAWRFSCPTGCAWMQRNLWELSCWWEPYKDRICFSKGEVFIGLERIYMAKTDIVQLLYFRLGVCCCIFL